MKRTVGFLAAVGGALGAAEWRKRNRASPVNHHRTATRLGSIAKFGTQTGATYGVHRARRVFASAERKDDLDRAFEIKTAQQAAELLGNMKGAMMKLGQMASYLDQGLPENVRNTLAQLQQDAPPMSVELVRDVLVDELGAKPEDLFAEWDPEPIAAASIGQVHRAFTHEGEAVAVKVQYPGVDRAIASDLQTADVLFRAMTVMFPGLDPEPLVEELKARVIEELDYELEADNQRLFARHYDGHPFIHIPEVIPQYSTKRVLTTALAPGSRFDEMLLWSDEERNLAAETIYRFAFGSIYRLGAFNGDPHPGNYLFEPGGKVTFLDFGLVKRFDKEALSGFEDMLRAMVLDRDQVEFRRVLERLGLLKPGLPFSDELVTDYFSHFYEFVREPGPFAITEEYASATVRHIFDPTGPFSEIRQAANVPEDFVIIQRINLGLYAIFGQLDTIGDWRRIAEELWPWVDGPPATPMGHEILAWRDAQQR